MSSRGRGRQNAFKRVASEGVSALDSESKMRYMDIMKTKQYSATPEQHIANWLKNYIELEMEDEDCVDNYRWAELGNPKQAEVYVKARRNGCCGSWDRVVVAPDDKTYAVGCNFGH